MKKKKFLSRELDAKSKETLNELLAIRNWTFHNSQSMLVAEREVAKKSIPPELVDFKKDVTIDFSRLALSAIKIAYEYSFLILGEEYLNDEVAMLFSRELKKNAYSNKKSIKVSSELARFVIFPIYGSGIEMVLAENREYFTKTSMDIVHTIFMINQDGCLYCVLNLCMMDALSFVIKVTEHAENYKKQLPCTLVFRDGTVESF